MNEWILGASLRAARSRLAQAKGNSSDALARYMSCVEQERTAEAEVRALEEGLDELGKSRSFQRVLACSCFTPQENHAISPLFS